MYKDFQDYGWDVESYCHKVYAGKEKDTGAPVVITTWQSIYKLPKSYFERFEVVIGDEAHLFKSKSLISIMTKLCDAKYRYGFTGTLDGTQTHKWVLEGLFGPAYKVTRTDELMKQGHLSQLDIQCLVLKHPPQKFEVYNDEIFIHGGVDVEERESARSITEAETNAIIIASYGTFSTGINIKNLHNVIFASPSKSRVRNLQSIGRVLRKGSNKFAATLFDIADDCSYKTRRNYTLNHLVERIKIYNEEDFNYEIVNINFKENAR